MNEADAVISTARATWALVTATWVLAALTLIVAIAAVGVPRWQRSRDKEDAQDRIQDVDGQAEEAVRITRALIAEIKTDLEGAVAYDEFSLWALANRLHTQRRVVEFFFVPGSVSLSIPYRLSACLQAIDESADGVQRAIDKDGLQEGAHKAAMRKSGAATVARSLDRLDNTLAPHI